MFSFLISTPAQQSTLPNGALTWYYDIYLYTKLALAMMCIISTNFSDLKHVILRAGMVYGPGDRLGYITSQLVIASIYRYKGQTRHRLNKQVHAIFYELGSWFSQMLNRDPSETKLYSSIIICQTTLGQVPITTDLIVSNNTRHPAVTSERR